MKFFRRATVVILSAMIIMLAAACENEQSKLIGTWEREVDITSTLSEITSGEMADYCEDLELKYTFVLSFDGGGVCRAGIDKESFADSVDKFKTDMGKALREYYTDYYKNTNTDTAYTLDKFFEDLENGMGMTVEELMSSSVDAALDIDKLADEAKTEGRFKVKDGKLFTSDTADAEIDESVYRPYELVGNKLTINAYVGNDTADNSQYPMEFIKAE